MKNQMSEEEFNKYVEFEARNIKAPDFRMTELQRYRYECIMIDKFVEDFKKREEDYETDRIFL